MNDRPQASRFPLYILFTFALLVIGISAAAYVFYSHHSRFMEASARNDLVAIADIKVREITDWRKERLGDAKVIYSSTSIIRRIQQFIQNPRSPGVRKELLSWMKSLPDSYQYRSVLLLDPRMRVRLSVGDEERLVGSTAVSLAESALKQRRIVFSDLRRGEVRNVVRLDIFVPLFLAQGREGIPVGVIVLRADPEQFLYPLLQTWPVPSASAESLLISREGSDVVFLNELRHRRNTALTFRLPLSEESLPAVMAARGKEGIVEGLDYRGVKVLAALRAVPGTPWYLVAKVDSGEVYAPLRRQVVMALALMILLIAAAGLAMGYSWRNAQAGFYRREYEAALERDVLERRYKHLSRYANDIILLMDEDWRIVEANDRAWQAYGYSREELLQMTIREIRDPATLPDLALRVRQLDMTNGRVYVTAHRRKDGSVFPVEISARKIEVEGKTFYQGIIRDITERRKAEEALLESEHRLKALFENMSSCVAVYEAVGDGEDFRFKDFNRSAEKTEQVERKDLIGKSVQEAFPAVKEFGLFEVFQRVWRTGRPEHYPVRKYKDNRIEGWRENYVYKLPSGEIVALYNNVSDRKKAEEALIRSEELYRELVENINDIVFSLDLKGSFTYVNPVVEQVLGYKPSEVVGCLFRDYIYEEDLPRLLSSFKDVLKGVIHPDEFRVLRKDGELRWVRSSSRPIRVKDEVIGIRGIASDVTERKEAEELYRTLAEGSQIASYIVQDRKILFASAHLSRYSGYTSGELIGKEILPFVHPEDRAAVREKAVRMLKGESAVPYEYRIIDRGGQVRWLLETVASVMYRGKRATLGSTMEITEQMRVRMELEKTRDMLIQSEKLAAVGELSAGVAHEILNPLNIISMRLQLVEMTEPLSDKLKDACRVARAQIERITKITQDLSQFSRVTTKHASTVDLREVMEAVFALTAPRQKMERVSLDFRYDPEIPALTLDRFRMEQVFLNLINNAVDAMKEAKEKVLRVQVSLVTSERGKHVQIAFSDSGTGIPAEILHRIFEPFFTTKEAGKGTGLGLSICYGIIQDHEGRIWAENNDEGGATVCIELPMESAGGQTDSH